MLPIRVLLLGAVVACSGEDDNPSDTAAPPDDTAPVEETGSVPSPSPEISVALSAPRVRGRPDETATVELTVTRTNYDGAVEVSVAGLPAQVTAAPLTIPGGLDIGTLTLNLGATAQPGGPVELSVSAFGEGDDAPAPVTVPLSLVLAGPLGGLDTSFSFDGQVTFRAGDSATVIPSELAIDGDGRIIVCGLDFEDNDAEGWLTRFLPNGDIDTGFDTDGSVYLEAPSAFDQIVIGPDDGLVGLAEIDLAQNYALTAFAADGAPDAGFGAAGEFGLGQLVSPNLIFELVRAGDDYVLMTPGDLRAISSAGVEVAAFNLVPVQISSFFAAAADGSELLLGGRADNDQLVVERRLASGAPDLSFGAAGALLLDVDEAGAEVRAVAPIPGGGGVVVTERAGSQGRTTEVVRFDDAGAIVSTYGTGGTVVYADGNETRWESLVVLDDGGVLLGGGAADNYGFGALNPDGSPNFDLVPQGFTFVGGPLLDMILDPVAGRLVVLTIPPSGGFTLSRYWL